MDPTALKAIVESSVRAKFTAGDAFTSVDISHPIIAANPTVRHSDVRLAIRAMVADGEMAEANYTSTYISVSPQPGKNATARLYHPFGYDVSSYTATNQEIVRSVASDANDVLTDAML